MMFIVRHHCKAHKKLLPKWFGPFVIKKMFIDNGFHEFENVDGSPYLNPINHEKGFGYVFSRTKTIMNLE